MKSVNYQIVLFFLMLCLSCATVAQVRQKPMILNEGKIIPNITIIDASGNELSILKLAAKSKYTLIDFWASWCSPCREEFPRLEKVYASWNKEGFNILGIAIGDKEADWRKALVEEGATWLHGRDIDYAVQKQLDVVGVPSYLLIDREGKLIAASVFTNSSLIQFGPAIRGVKGLQETLEKLLRNK